MIFILTRAPARPPGCPAAASCTLTALSLGYKGQGDTAQSQPASGASTPLVLFSVMVYYTLDHTDFQEMFLLFTVCAGIMISALKSPSPAVKSLRPPYLCAIARTEPMPMPGPS